MRDAVIRGTIIISLTDNVERVKPNKKSDFQVEEENVAEEEQTEAPFVEEPEGAESKPHTGPTAVEDEPQVEEEFEWGDQDV